MRQKIKGIVQRIAGQGMLKRIERDNTFVYKGLQLNIPAGVFHPKYFTSSSLLMDLMETEKLEGKSVLELGCGSGITSLIAASRGARVTACDISQLAVSNLKENSIANQVDLQVVHSDLFDSITTPGFDYILINPPFYPKAPALEKEHAWYCGENFEYFHKLFSQLLAREDKAIYMTLSNDCDLDMIRKIGGDFNYELVEQSRRSHLMETNYLFLVNRME